MGDLRGLTPTARRRFAVAVLLTVWGLLAAASASDAVAAFLFRVYLIHGLFVIWKLNRDAKGLPSDGSILTRDR